MSASLNSIFKSLDAIFWVLGCVPSMCDYLRQAPNIPVQAFQSKSGYEHSLVAESKLLLRIQNLRVGKVVWGIAIFSPYLSMYSSLTSRGADGIF
jgi:hypothetical protein